MKTQGKNVLIAATALIALATVSSSQADTLKGQVEYEVVYHLDVAVSGEVKSVSAQEGNRVTEGTVLMQLDATSLEAHRNAALAKKEYLEAVVQEAARSLQRDEELYADGSLSTVELDIRKIDLLKAKADLQHSNAVYLQSLGQISYSRIVAPTAGIVIKRNVNPGERIVIDNRVGPAFIFASDHKVIRAEVDTVSGTIPASGSTVEITYPGGKMSGQVKAVDPYIRPQGAVLTIITDRPLPQAGQTVEINYD